MKSLSAFVAALLLVLLIFYGIAVYNMDNIPLVKSLSKPIAFYRLRRIKAEKKIHKKKKNTKKKAVARKLPPKKLAKKINKNIKDETQPTRNVQEIVDINDLDQEAVVLKQVMPRYPEAARRAGIESTVLVEIVVDERGQVANTQILRESQKGYGFSEEAIRAVRNLRFQPFKINGKTTKVKLIYPVQFVLLE